MFILIRIVYFALGIMNQHKKNILFLFLSLQTCFFLQGQVSYSGQKGDIFSELRQSNSAEVVIFQDKKIETLFLKNIQKKNNSPQIPGYRIRIYSNLGQSAREGSLDAESKFSEEYPNIPVYRMYEAPYFKVYVGDFRTKIEAHRFLKKVRNIFPDAFDIPCDIYFPII
jgi:hypothetical protein